METHEITAAAPMAGSLGAPALDTTNGEGTPLRVAAVADTLPALTPEDSLNLLLSIYTKKVLPRLLHIGIVAALLLSLLIAYACLASSGDSQIYGAPWTMETWNNRHPHLNYSITLPYCHLARDTAAEIHWLQQARSLTGEDVYLNDTSQRWRNKHCIVDAHTLVSAMIEGENALTRSTWADIVNFSARFAPRIASVVLDLRNGGRLLYPVLWMDNIRGHAPLSGLVDHNVLCLTLEEMTQAYAEKLTEHKVPENQIGLPCFCPIHLGLVGSGLHFIHAATKQTQLRRQEEVGEREIECRWNILVDARSIVGTYHKESYEKVERQHVLRDIFEWEKRILGGAVAAAEPVGYNTYATIQAYNLAPLLGADQDFRFSGVGFAASDAAARSGLGERLLLRDLQSMRVYTVSVDAQDNPNACFQHCQRLEAAVLGEHYDADYKFAPVTYTPITSQIRRALPAEATTPAQVPLSVRDLTDRMREERQKRLRERQEKRERH